VAELIGSQAPTVFEVWPENWPPLELFMLCQTQWRTGPAGLLGLDYGAVLAMASLWGMDRVREAMADVQIIEATILEQLSKEAR
jgi:hypothetical protein